jgi:NADPH2:quinone reductase
MRAVVVREHGELEALSYEEDNWVTPKSLRTGEVLVKNEYAGLNFIDTYYRTGVYATELPFICGQEGGGIVVAVHPSVADIEVGDNVVYMSMGTYCEYSKVLEEKIVKIPDDLSMETALCCMVQGLTAHYLVTDAQGGLTKKGDWMLIYSVGSGTGQWAAQMAKLQGYRVIGTTSKAKSKVAPKAWFDELIILDPAPGKSCADYESVDICQRVMEITDGKGVKCILDGVGKSTCDISINCLAKRGLWISFGNASGVVPPLSLMKLTTKSAYCTRPKLGDYVSTKYELRSRAQEVFQWVATGQVDVRVDAILALEDVREGHAYLEAGRSRGKILFKI